MSKKINFNLWLLVIALVFGVALSIPSLFSTAGPKITLGLDLQGGLNLLLGVKTQDAIKSKYASLASTISYQSKDRKILIDRLKIREDAIEFELIDSKEAEKLAEFLRSFEGTEFENNGEIYTLKLSEEGKKQVEKSAIEQAISTIRNRLDKFGLSEPSVTQQGGDKILVQLPGIKTMEEEKRARDLIARPAHLQMMAVDEERNARVGSMSEGEAAAFGDVILPYVEGSVESNSGAKLLLKAVPIIDGAMITDASSGFDQNNQAVVHFTLNGAGAKIFGDFSGASVGKRMAIVLDGKVYSAPVIRERIGGGSGQISGNFTMQEASDLAIALKSGALPASMEVLEKRSVGPSLGEDSIRASMIALVSGFLLVVGFMMAYYSVAGGIASIALVGNVFLIIAVMSLFGATLTLPGMAGIVLTVGMAVDANIIINERIREVLREGVGVKKAIELGYANASRAIFDSNSTTLIAAVLLYAYGTGAIKGFALTMGIGILISVVTAIFGTHGVYTAIATRMEKSIAKNNNLNFWFGIKLPK